VVSPNILAKSGTALLELEIEGQGKILLSAGELRLIELETGKEVSAMIKPLHTRIDLGNGPGRVWQGTIKGGVVGLILDGRGRPLVFPENDAQRESLLRSWYQAFGLSGG
jgi:hypothetical protein